MSIASQPRTADGDAFRFRAGRPSLDLCSTLLWRNLDAVELLRSPHDVGRWRLAAGLGRAADAPTDDDLLQTRVLREAVYRVMTAHVDDRPLPRREVAVVNAAASLPCLVPRLGLNGELGWRTGEPFTAALSTIARDAIDLISGAWSERIRQCAAADCAFLFVDMSRPGTRRWCAMSRCGNREHVRRHRSRARAVSAPTKARPAQHD
ncbi:MAG TPA: ABATE domain-containing protein [Jatrophihabitantaceae bacterium]|nr:ABATE domain-containing protein [Jatrophihabitantaceae bacterium]